MPIPIEKRKEVIMIVKFRSLSLFALTSVLLAASLIWNSEQAAANDAEDYS
ncbi:hypothetical protein GNF98_15020, partial [Clostridium perfringens]